MKTETKLLWAVLIAAAMAYGSSRDAGAAPPRHEALGQTTPGAAAPAPGLAFLRPTA